MIGIKFWWDFVLDHNIEVVSRNKWTIDYFIIWR